MKKNILYDYLKDKPSFLRYQDEVTLIHLINNLSIEWIELNQSEFIQALRVLSSSHTEGNGFLEQKEEDDVLFENFCQKLIEINKITGISTLVYIDDLLPKSLGLNEFREQFNLGHELPSITLPEELEE